MLFANAVHVLSNVIGLNGQFSGEAPVNQHSQGHGAWSTMRQQRIHSSPNRPAREQHIVHKNNVLTTVNPMSLTLGANGFSVRKSSRKKVTSSLPQFTSTPSVSSSRRRLRRSANRVPRGCRPTKSVFEKSWCSISWCANRSRINANCAGGIRTVLS